MNQFTTELKISRDAISYRPDIDGLRAVAVSAVLIFHFFPPKLPGGFVGVDIFFVISGFLITGIILRELDAGKFTFRGFYSRRIRRIFPSLALVLTVTLVAGWATLLPSELQQLAQHTLGGAGFIANVMFWREAGYFDAAAQSKPLLHLWSLGIEEQFYIAWPLLLAAVFGRIRRLLPIVGALVLLSFLLNVATVVHYPEAVYYDPATRMWELLIGAGLARYLAGARKVEGAASEIASIVGSILIAASLLLTTEQRPFPGWWAVLPTVGAALMILAGGGAWLNRKVLATRGFVLVGLISYPLYLWHWPLLTYFRLIDDSDWNLPYSTSRWIRLGLLALAVILSWATWRFWETPLRNAKRTRGMATVPLLIGLMIGICVVGSLCVASVVMPRLASPVTIRMEEAITDWEEPTPSNYKADVFQTTVLRSSNPDVTLFVGDSHATQYLPRVRAVLARNPALPSVAFAVHASCPPMPGLNRGAPGFDCPKFYRFWTAEAEHAKTVVISAYWETFFAHRKVPFEPSVWLGLVTASGVPADERDVDRSLTELSATISKWIASGKRVVIISSNPASRTFNPLSAMRRLGKADLALMEPVRQEDMKRFQRPVEEHLAALAKSGAEIIWPADFLCHAGVCSPLDPQGNLMYMDSNHLRASFTAQRANFIDDLLRPRPESAACLAGAR